jgi:hypothetical protein
LDSDGYSKGGNWHDDNDIAVPKIMSVIATTTVKGNANASCKDEKQQQQQNKNMMTVEGDDVRR